MNSLSRRYLQREASDMFLCSVSPRRKHNQIAKERACLFPSSTQTSIFPQRNRSLISRGISTFLMISFDYDKLLNAVIYFCCFPRYILSTVDLCVYTSDKHFVRSRFILIAPLCQRLLMIFYRTLHSAFRRCLFVLDGAHAGTTQILIKPRFISKGTRDYTISFEAEPVLRKEQRT